MPLDKTPGTTTLQGHTKAKYITDDQIEQFIEGLHEGKTPQEAALDAGSSLTQFRWRYEKEPALEERVKQAVADGRITFMERLRAMLHWHLFVDKNPKLLRDALMVYDPDFQVLRTQRFEHTHTATLEIEQKLAQYSTEELKAILRLEEAKDQHPVLEIPPKSQAA